eukprot:scaffold104956_cov28-Tisochrysis_lutea.AAC.3
MRTPATVEMHYGRSRRPPRPPPPRRTARDPRRALARADLRPPLRTCCTTLASILRRHVALRNDAVVICVASDKERGGVQPIALQHFAHPTLRLVLLLQLRVVLGGEDARDGRRAPVTPLTSSARTHGLKPLTSESKSRKHCRAVRASSSSSAAKGQPGLVSKSRAAGRAALQPLRATQQSRSGLRAAALAAASSRASGTPYSGPARLARAALARPRLAQMERPPRRAGAPRRRMRAFGPPSRPSRKPPRPLQHRSEYPMQPSIAPPPRKCCRHARRRPLRRRLAPSRAA